MLRLTGMLHWVVVSLLLLCESNDVSSILDADAPCPVDPKLVLSVVERAHLAPESSIYGVLSFFYSADFSCLFFWHLLILCMLLQGRNSRAGFCPACTGSLLVVRRMTQDLQRDGSCEPFPCLLKETEASRATSCSPSSSIQVRLHEGRSHALEGQRSCPGTELLDCDSLVSFPCLRGRSLSHFVCRWSPGSPCEEKVFVFFLFHRKTLRFALRWS